MDPAALGALGVQVVAGRPYSASATDEIMLGWQAAEDLGKRVGDTLPLDDTIYRVVGIYSIEQVFGDVASMLPLIPMQARWHPFHTGLVAGALVAVAVTLLIVQNGQSVRVSRLAFHFRSPEWIVLFVTAAAGAVVWELIRAGFRRARHRRRAGGQGRPDPAR